MLRLARFSITRPFVALAIWIPVAIALAVVGLGVSDHLSPSKATVSGTESARAVKLADEQFGPSQLVPVLLEGPRRDVKAQGKLLARRLAARPGTRVMTPWDGGPLAKRLRPNAGAAMVIAAVARTDKEMFNGEQARIDKLVDRTVRAPVRSYVTGTPALERGLADASIDTTRRAELIAIPLLFLVLLLITRAPVAALVISLFGAATSMVGFGVTALLGRVTDVAPIAVALGSLTGLALGVAYALLIQRRWASVRAGGASPADAATEAIATSGRAVLIGGTALVVAMALSALIGPTDVLGSEGIGVVLCALLGIGSAVVVMPAVLVALGARMRWGSFPAPAFATRTWDRLVGSERAVTGHAIPMALTSAGLLAVLAIPTLSLEAGPPSPLRLPSGSHARQAYEEVGRVMGPGWVAPYNLVIASKTRPLTDPALLRDVAALQKGIGARRDVVAVAGPGVFAATSQDLKALPKKLQESTKLVNNGKKDLGRLQNGLGRAGAGALQLRAGLQQAAAGAGQLHGGSGSAQAGAGQLRAGLDKARAGASAISGGLGQALTGAQKLRDGAGLALAGTEKIRGGLGQAAKPVKQGLPIVRTMAADVRNGSAAVASAKASADRMDNKVGAALDSLRGVDDPRVDAAIATLNALRGDVANVNQALGTASPKLSGASAVAGAFATQVQQLSAGLAQLYSGSTALQGGISDLRSGNAKLASGIARLSAGGGSLTTGLVALRDGASRLEAGLGQLTSGSGQLASGIAGGIGPVGQLSAGLDKMKNGIADFRSQLPSTKDLERLNRESPDLFRNGYFVLAAIAGAREGERNLAHFAVNLDRGGTAGEVMVVPTAGSGTKANVALGHDLRAIAARFAARTHTEVAVGGQAAQFDDFDTAGTAKLAPVVAGVALAVALLLMLFLRSVLLPLVSVAASLLSTAVAFGVLQTLYGGSDPLLGGPGSFSPVSIMGIFAAAFGITTVLQVVLLVRAREHYLASGDARGSLDRALRDTAAAATGAAAVMVAAAIPFMASSFMTVAQFGVGVTAAVLTEALITRPVLLPALVALAGRRSWWPLATRGGGAATGGAAPPPARA